MNILMTTADHLMIDRRIIQEAKTLIAHGHQVTLLAGFECQKRESYILEGIRVERFVYDWSDSRFLRISKKLKLRTGSFLYKAAWRVFRSWSYRVSSLNSFDQYIFDRMSEYQVDMVHVHDYPMLTAGVALAKMRGVRIVYDAHELYYAQTQLAARVQKKYKKNESRLMRHVDAAITVNPYIADIIGKRYGVKTPWVIMNAAPPRTVSHGDLLRMRFNLPSSTRIVVYQGWISDNRGIDCIVESAKYFSENVALIVIGYGDYEATLRKMVEDHNLSSRVFFYGGVPSDELHPLTCGADLGIIPYHGVDENNFFCSPNKLFEFAVANIPFICNDLPFLRDIVEKFGNGVISDLRSPQAAARSINQVFADPEKFCRLKEGAELAGMELNWDVEGRKLMDIYASL